jgi:hypothetical protein
MADLVTALGDFIAALLSAAGFVGQTRRRAAIRDDLNLLKELETHPLFDRDTYPHTWLSTHITLEIAKFSGIDLRTSRRKPQWGSLLLATIIWVGTGWLAWSLDHAGHGWYAVLPGCVSALFFLVCFPLLFNKEELVPDEDATEDTGENGDQTGQASGNLVS